MIEVPLMNSEKTIGVEDLDVLKGTYWTGKEDELEGIDYYRLYTEWAERVGA